jgi:hypothetical protein
VIWNDAAANIAVRLRLSIHGDLLSFIITVTVFGTPLDATLAELAVTQTEELLCLLSAGCK